METQLLMDMFPPICHRGKTNAPLANRFFLNIKHCLFSDRIMAPYLATNQLLTEDIYSFMIEVFRCSLTPYVTDEVNT